MTEPEAATELTMCQKEGHLLLDRSGLGVPDGVEGVLQAGVGGCAWPGRKWGLGSWMWQSRSQGAGTRGPCPLRGCDAAPQAGAAGSGNAVSGDFAFLQGLRAILRGLGSADTGVGIFHWEQRGSRPSAQISKE